MDRTYFKGKNGGRGLIGVEEYVMLEKTCQGFCIDGKEGILLIIRTGGRRHYVLK